ncbi:hypothetical protein [Cohnella herbarum]|uniref:Uncharacterized protein n=1 Tax=Cohnella herbarum TaxID=2728023 RepID=A0A7Z2VGA5_9BACL|nr:hypothetical protein [Cohnella herbarum]QJD82668.1 hypothetical protein HH215_05355 [Cohnella herbarum]
MVRLQQISLVFPNTNEKERQWNSLFLRLLSGIPSYRNQGFEPSFAETALPSTRFEGGTHPFPLIQLAVDQNIHLSFGNIAITSKGSNFSLIETENAPITPIAGTSNVASGNTLPYLYEQLKGRITGIDHTGVNIPATIISPTVWDEFINGLSEVCNLYYYPDAPWPFIIPADETEYATEITEFNVKRTPKFELVYDTYTNKPIFQFALETDVTREEMELILPEPIGFAIPGLADIFRSVVVRHPWEDDIGFRFDLYYRPTSAELTDWETGEWLVRTGGRVKG